MLGNVEEVLSQIKPNDLVLDVGGWACPFNRANWVIDAEPYETRGFYERHGMGKAQGGKEEYFSKDTWIQRDICDKEPWPFADNFFDFSICSHTLEDIRDPLYVCSELSRVSKGGYIEVPSRLAESCRGAENSRIAGLSHHRWLVDITDHHVQFTMKYHLMHSDFQLSFPPSFAKKLSSSETISYLFWKDDFTFSETQIHGVKHIHENLRSFVAKRYHYPNYRFLLQWLSKQFERGINGVGRRFGV
jgi:hypothetical protein